MAEIIDLSKRLERRGENEHQDGGTIYRIWLCGPDRQELEAAGRGLGRAFILEGHYIAFEEPEQRPTLFILRAGREVVTETGYGRCPGLVVTAASQALTPANLQGCSETTLLLAHGAEPLDRMRERLGFVGTVVPLPVAASAREPFGLAAACAGGAARLLGAIRWTSLEQGLREEFAGLEQAAVNRLLAMALEAYDRSAPWAGRVETVREEVELAPLGC